MPTAPYGRFAITSTLPASGAFNMMTPGVFDIFAPLADDEYNKALFAREAYRRDNSTKGPGDALYDFLVELQLDAKFLNDTLKEQVPFVR